MLTLLSPAKKLLSSWGLYQGTMTHPVLLNQSAELIQIMKKKSVGDIAAMMHLSKDLATLNYERFQRFTLDNSSCDRFYPAVLLFQGDVYQGLQAQKWTPEVLEYSQHHLGILSGLYGLLNPLDGIQPYRLEMGTKLANSKGSNLYDFWRLSITQVLNKKLTSHTNKILINLASTEYFSAVDVKNINYPIVTVNFYEQKNDALKMIGIYAKKARGTMASYLMTQHIDDLEGVKQFTGLGYKYNPNTSTGAHLDFIRAK